MKTSDKSSLHLFRQICSAAVTAAIVLGASGLGAFPIITNVVETGGDNEATDTVPAKWTGVTYVGGVANEPVIGLAAGASYTVGLFRVAAPAYVDRAHAWTNASATVLMPPYLLGGEYIMIGNDNRDNAAFQLQISVASPVRAYLLLDNRINDGANGNPPTLGTNTQWVLDDGWTPVITGVNRAGSLGVPDEIGIDEGADGTINNYSSVYVKLFPAGTFITRQQNAGGINMYGVVVVPAFPPNAPANFIAVAGDGKVTLTWSGVGADGYLVKRSLNSGGPYTTLATITSTTYVDLDVVNNTTYYYVASAFNALGDSPDSTEAVATPKAAPRNLVAIGGTNRIELRWDALAGAASYTVKRSTGSGGPYTTVDSGIVGTSFIDTPLEAGRTYYYVAVAQLTGGGDSGQCSEVSAVTAPGAPTLIAPIWSTTIIQVKWAHSNPVVTQFNIQRSTDGSTFSDLVSGLAPTNRFYLDQGLSASTTYFYRIQAQNGSGFSDYSNVASNTTPSGGWNVNFANAVNGSPANNPAPTPPGYVQDVGEVFGDRGNGFTYGWTTLGGTNITSDGRWRQNASSPDLRYDTFNHFMKRDAQNPAVSATWEMDIPNGFYLVHIVSGDVTAVDSTFQHVVEGVTIGTYVPVTGAWWGEFTNGVIISDGRLTIQSGSAARNNKINFVDIYPAVPTLAVIGTQPQSQTVDQNRPVSFSVVVANGYDPLVSPLSYQWYRNDAPVPGATTPTLSIPLAQLGDQGSYFVEVSNYAGPVKSATAVLTVTQDTAAPRALSVGSVDGFKIGVCFDEILDTNAPSPTAIDTANYAINGGAISVVGAVFRPDARSVELTLDAPVVGSFTVQIENVQDLAGNGLAAPVPLVGEVFGLAQDLGYPLAAGSHYSCASNSLELVGGGADLWGTYDEGHFACKMVTGNFDARVRVDSLTLAALTGGGNIAKAGLMARPYVESNSPTLHLLANPPPPGRNQLEAGVRTTVNGATASWGSTLAGVGTSNLWLRLTRVGNSFVGYWSSNGVAWGQFASTTLALDAALAVGPVVSAHTNFAGLLVTGAFSNFKLSGLCAGTPPVLTNLSYTAGPPAQFSFQFASESGCTYLVEYKDNLEAATWTLLATLPGTGGLLTVTDSGAEPKRFYRVRLP